MLLTVLTLVKDLNVHIVLAGFGEPRGQVQDFKPRGFSIIWPNRLVFNSFSRRFIFNFGILAVPPWSSARI
jgi:hypothetical protein